MSFINQVGNSLTGLTGTGAFVGANTPTLITPVIGAATGTSLITTGNLTAGLAAGSSAGTLISYPSTTSQGSLIVAAANNASGNFNTTISNATAIGQAQVVSIPDSGASTAKFILSTGAGQTIGAGLTLTTPVLGAATATSLTFSPTTGGIVGTTTNDDTTAGDVGQFVSSVIASGSPVSLNNNAATNITSISLTAGDWDVWGNATVKDVVTGVTEADFWVSATSATIPDGSLRSTLAPTTGFMTNVSLNAPQQRFSLSGTTTVYLSVYSAATGATSTGFGAIYARRRR